MIGAKLSDQRNSKHACRFKFTNQRLASRGSPTSCTRWTRATFFRYEDLYYFDLNIYDLPGKRKAPSVMFVEVFVKSCHAEMYV